MQSETWISLSITLDPSLNGCKIIYKFLWVKSLALACKHGRFSANLCVLQFKALSYFKQMNPANSLIIGKREYWLYKLMGTSNKKLVRFWD